MPKIINETRKMAQNNNMIKLLNLLYPIIRKPAMDKIPKIGMIINLL